MNEKDDDKIRNLLKKSPTLTPPESFYRGVMEKIEKKSGRVESESPGWMWGIPMKALASAALVMVIVLAVREKRPTNQTFETSTPTVVGGGSKDMIDRLDSPSASRGNDESMKVKELAESNEVQSRVNRSISGMVQNPSPFEEEDEALRKTLKADMALMDLEGKRQAAAPRIAAKKELYVEQARDTLGGMASQDSFRYSSLKQKDATPTRAWQGSTSAILAPREVIIRSNEEWRAFWDEHQPDQAPNRPAVNFDQDMVIGVLAGTKPSGGYRVDIVDVQTSSDRVTVKYHLATPSKGMAQTMALEQPYHLKIIPKTPLPITFEKIP